jgi:hypothetical protein
MNKAESADLILKLYDLRREETMREARKWFIGFFPESAADITATMVDDQASAYYRMVTSYWEMAAGFVTHGAIDEEMFLDANGEAIIVFSKVEPFLEEMRQILGSEKYLKHLETLIMKIPDAKEMLAARRAQMKRMMELRAEAKKTEN